MPKTLESDTNELSILKQSIDPSTIRPSSFLSTWNFKHDPCENMEGFFQGILCRISDDNSRSRVTALNLDPAGYDGLLPPSIGNLTDLVVLSLSNNNLRGPIPDSIVQLRKLNVLALSANFFTGELPGGILNLHNLESLDVSNNVLVGTIPAGLAGLRRLSRLGLSKNKFHGEIPNLSGLWQLSSLDLSQNQFRGSVPQLPANLRQLSLHHNLLSGHLPKTLSLPRLEILDLSRNHFGGQVANWLLELPSIRRIDVSGNALAGLQVYNFTGRATTLESINTSWNHIGSHLPAMLVTIGGLREIDLSHNRLRGRIPERYGAMVGRSWRRLFLNDNYLVGDVPKSLVRKEALRMKGSLASNCLRCPSGLSLCRGGQRTRYQCSRYNSKD
ncbi:receptor-like protein 36 [Nymphaea colorata]|nr:receptor-like protein 36 [Nymphaea colorata]